MTRLLAVPLGYVLNWLYDLLGNYGLTIIVFTLIIRLIILPLYAAQLKSSQRMMEVQPKLKEIQTKYAGNTQKINEKIQEIYAEEKINPASGCLPLLIQIPIIWGLFGLLRNPMKFITNDSMVLAVHESFFWISDLSQPDLWILPIIAAVATFISMKITNAMTFSSGNNPAMASMKAMQYFMPAMVVWMAHSMPAGIALYWAVSYIFQIFQIMVTKNLRHKKQDDVEPVSR